MMRAQKAVLRAVRKQMWGYTLVEAMIFLAVSSAIALSAMTVISGQQRKTEFQQSVRDLESSLQDISNDVATGFSGSNNGNCWMSAAGVVQTSANPNPPVECVFIGKVLEFNNTTSQFTVRSLVGRQKTPAGAEVGTLVAANPQVYTPGNQTLVLRGGARVGRITCSSCAPTTVGAFAFMTTFNSGTITSGTPYTDLIPVRPSALTAAPTLTAGTMATTNPASGLKLCLLSQGTNQHAVITLGGQGGQLTVSSVIEGGNTVGACP